MVVVPSLEDDASSTESVLHDKEVQVMSTSTSSSSNTPTSSTTTRVSFGSVEVRQYERVIGGGSHYENLASLGIGWRHYGSEVYNLLAPAAADKSEDEESSFEQKSCPVLTDANDRVNLLIKYGFSMPEIFKAEKDLQDLMLERERLKPQEEQKCGASCFRGKMSMKKKVRRNRGGKPAEWILRRMLIIREKLALKRVVKSSGLAGNAVSP
jgi:hypothetical protein